MNELSPDEGRREGRSGRLAEKRREAALTKRIELRNRLRSGAHWFYWIAALSVVNSIVVLSHGEWSFFIGLGVTQVVDAIALSIVEEAPDLKTIATASAILINLVAVTLCAVFGVLASRRKAWAFWVGMVLYALDGLLFLAVGDFLSLGFHVFALICIFNGVRALGELERLGPIADSEVEAEAGAS
jgi:hypothetical protein